MEVDRLHEFQDDGSPCSNHRPSSQPRKISVGITINPLGTKRSVASKKDKKENSPKMNGKGVAEGFGGKQTEAPEKVTSPWITTRSFHHKPPTSETFVLGKQTTSLPPSRGRRSKLKRPQNPTITHSVQFFENQLSILLSGDGNEKNFKGLTYKRKASKGGNSQRAEEFTFAAVQDVLLSDNVATENKGEYKMRETLRMKLWETLGIVSSPRIQTSNSQVHKECAYDLKLEKIDHQEGNTVVKPTQNSDTIETDSENPDHKMKRPATCSLNRNRVKNKTQPVRTKTCPSSNYINKIRKKKTFSFEDGLLGKGDVVVGHGSSMSARKKSSRRHSGIKPRKIHFSEDNNVDENNEGNCRSERPLRAEKASSLGDKGVNIHGFLPRRKGNIFEHNNRDQQRESHQSLTEDSHQSADENRVEQLEDVSRRAGPGNEDQREAFGRPSMNFRNLHDEFQSPTFKINTSILSCSPVSLPKTDQIEQKVQSLVPADEKFTLGKINTFQTLKNSVADCQTQNAKTDSSDDEMDVKDSRPREASRPKGKKEVEDGLSESSSVYKDPTSSEEETAEMDSFFPETAKAERPNFMLHPSKRLRNLEGKSVSKFSSTLLSTKGNGESDWNPEPSEQNQKNELERVITLLALAFENFKNKMNAAVRKKSSDILKTVSEDIHLQLHNVVSQIQTDVRGLTNFCKSKGKRLETRFQEEQAKERTIQNKFKQDIHQHLQDCKSTVEELRSHHVQLHAIAKKQKASRQNLLMEMEGAVEMQLNDAQRRITAVHQSARQQMIQTGQIIAECLREGNLSLT